MRPVGFPGLPSPPHVNQHPETSPLHFKGDVEQPQPQPQFRVRTWRTEVQELLSFLEEMPRRTAEQEQWHQELSHGIELYQKASGRRRGFSLKVATHYAPVMALIYDDFSRERRRSKLAFWRPSSRVVNEACRQRAIYWATVARCARNDMPERLSLENMPAEERQNIREKVIRFYQANQILPAFSLDQHGEFREIIYGDSFRTVADVSRWPVPQEQSSESPTGKESPEKQ